MLSLDVLQVFVRIAEAGGISAAARDLAMSKSAASKKLAALEDRLGARLFNRTTRRLSLTEAGTDFLDRAQRILAELEEAERVAGRLTDEPRGTLRVNAPMSFGILHVAPALVDFMTRYPDLTVTLDLDDRRVSLVDEGYDVAVRIADLPDSSLVARKLASARRVVCASPAYWSDRGVPTHPRDLASHNCLIYAYLSTQNDWRFRGPGGSVSVRVAGSLKANNGDVLREAALAGLGVFFAPTFLVGDDIRRGRLVTALDDFPDDTLAIYAVYPHRRHLSAKVRVFIDFLANRFGSNPYWDAA
ncbi:MAG: LysR family transcriptional regulator [Rhodospirillales bacterium]|jgi:DNA-binding transcriptional LysR family regulator|nr:LysR family transcriptional regulator [Rhodospirillales bacterium]